LLEPCAVNSRMHGSEGAGTQQCVPATRLIIGLQRSAIGTLVERTTRFTMLIQLPREAGYGVIARTRTAPPLPAMGPSR